MRNFDCLPHTAGSRRRCATQLSTYTTSPHRHLHTKRTVACRWRESLECDRVLYMWDTDADAATNGRQGKNLAKVHDQSNPSFLVTHLNTIGSWKILPPLIRESRYSRWYKPLICYKHINICWYESNFVVKEAQGEYRKEKRCYSLRVCRDFVTHITWKGKYA